MIFAHYCRNMKRREEARRKQLGRFITLRLALGHKPLRDSSPPTMNYMNSFITWTLPYHLWVQCHVRPNFICQDKERPSLSTPRSLHLRSVEESLQSFCQQGRRPRIGWLEFVRLCCMNYRGPRVFCSFKVPNFLIS